MRFLVFILAFFIFWQLNAQKTNFVQIIDPQELFSTYTFTKKDSLAIIKFGGEKLFKEIKLYSHENDWPSAINNLNGRIEGNELIKKYHATAFLSLEGKEILKIIPADNTHLPDSFQVNHVFYIIMGNNGFLEHPVTLEKRNEILDPGLLCPTYDLKFAPDALDVMRRRFSKSELGAIISSSSETEWPTGISNFENRQNHKDDFKKYIFHPKFDFNIYSVIEVRPEENQHMPKDMIPDHIIYFIFLRKGLHLEDEDQTEDVKPVTPATTFTTPAPVGFSAQLNTWIESFPDHFNALMGKKVESENTIEIGQVFKSTVQIDGASNCIIRKMDSNQEIGEVLFSISDSVQAYNKFLDIETKMDATDFTNVQFIKKKSNYSNLFAVYYLADQNHISNPGYKNLVLSLLNSRTMSLNTQGGMEEKWEVKLFIRNQ